MDEILGLTPTGREIRDPAARLVEATDEAGRHYTVVDLDDDHLGHEAVTLNVELVLSFMQFPMVTGLVGLDRYDLEKGQFAFGTGSVWTIRDVHRAFSDFGQVVGLRAGLELAWLASQVLVEAGETGPMQGCFSHGNVSPTRLALRGDGMVQVFGYGLPQVELIRHRDQDYPLEPQSLYYCPPERLEGVPEDSAADTYSLTLLVYELITGKPLYDTHDIDELRHMVGMSEGATLLSRGNRGLPPKVAKLLARSLIYDPDTRLSGQDYVDGIGRLLANEVLDGPSLSEVVQTLQGQAEAGPRRGRKLVSTKATNVFTPEQLAEIAAEEDDDEAADDASPRWSKVTRTRRSDDVEPEPEPESKPAGSSRRRRRAADDEPATKTAAPSRRRRRKSEAEPPPEVPADNEEPKRRRRRRGPTEADDASVEAAEATEASPEEPARPRRRNAKPTHSDDAEATSTRRRRRKPEAAEAEAEASEEAVAPQRARRRRGGDKPADDAPPANDEASPPAKRRRGRSDDEDDDAPVRRRRANDDDDDAPASGRRRRKKANDQDDSSRRRRRKKASDDDAANEPEPSRRRRKKASDDSAADEPAPSRRRRKKADDSADEPAASGRRRKKVDDDAADEPAPSRRRRKAPAEDDGNDEPPKRRRRRS